MSPNARRRKPPEAILPATLRCRRKHAPFARRHPAFRLRLARRRGRSPRRQDTTHRGHLQRRVPMGRPAARRRQRQPFPMERLGAQGRAAHGGDRRGGQSDRCRRLEPRRGREPRRPRALQHEIPRRHGLQGLPGRRHRHRHRAGRRAAHPDRPGDHRPRPAAGALRRRQKIGLQALRRHPPGQRHQDRPGRPPPDRHALRPAAQGGPRSPGRRHLAEWPSSSPAKAAR